MARKTYLLLLLLLTLGPARTALAAPPTLGPLAGDDLPGVFQAGRAYTVRMRYTDPDGDPPKTARFVYQGPSGQVPKDFTNIVGQDYRSGVTIEWAINGFEQGAHQAYFVATSVDGETRYPPADSQFYTFVVESLVVKWSIMGVGLVIGLIFVPFLVYVLARTLNRRGDPAGAARIGLLIGILACCALFIYLFLSFYGPLTWAIGILAALALLIVVLTRR